MMFPIAESHDLILKRTILNAALESDGPTALGPALCAAVGLACGNTRKGTSIFVLTDGKANKGFG